MSFNLADLFESVADTVPDASAVVVGDRRLTYAQLDERASRLARHLLERGVGPGDFVGLQLSNGSEYLEAMLACFKVRAVPVNVNYRYVGAELAHLFADAGLVGLIHHRRFTAQVDAVLDAMADQRVRLVVDDPEPERDQDHDVHRDADDGRPPSGALGYEAALAAAPPGRPEVRRSGDDLYCVYTGGTTGRPKGVLWRHEDIFFAAMGGGDPMQLGLTIDSPEQLPERVLRPGLTALATPPLMHASAHWLAFSTLFGGGTLVMLPGAHFDPAEVLRVAAAEQVNILVVVGDAMARPVLDELERRVGSGETPDTSSLMAVGSGGAILSPSTKRRLAELLPAAMVVDGFGSSETGLLGNSRSGADDHGSVRLQVDERTTVLDEQGQVVEPGSATVGFLARGGRVPLRYHGDPAKSAATFIEVDGRRWALPGDLARVEADGTIVVLGRASQCINSGGEKVHPEEVESALKDHPDVADVVVVGVADDRWGERVVAVVAPRAGTEPTLEQLKEHLRDRIAGYKLPKQVVAVPAVERSPSGKADYRWAQAVAAAAAPPT
jgi:acyl-CoA synthetase (AMP-forming)/AMP-acid ligase II